uniref:Phosphoglycerate mutase (2,3-diphosphoglycerate-independent) n=1 Tax=Strongyloides stercoralis TaxID=6248 RepID=A0A0K0DXB5_STRER
MTSSIKGERKNINISIKIIIVSSFFILISFFPSIQGNEESYKNNFKCWVSDPNSCDRSKKEICAFIDGTYMCSCPPGVKRNNEGICTIFNECLKTSDNDCGDNAYCIDQEEGYTCQCNPGFVDLSSDVYRPGRVCVKKVNECASPKIYNVDCHKNADCHDTDDSYKCICRTGYEDLSSEYSKLPGRECVKMINECQDGTNDCGINAICVDQKEGYFCKCKPGYVDVSEDITNFPGRQCHQPMEQVTAAYNTYGGYNAQTYKNNINPPSPSPEVNSCDPLNPKCGPNRICLKNAYGTHHCQCERGTVDDNGVCRIFNHCDRGNDCDPMAICSNEIDGYRCQCKPGFKDESVDPLSKPGRVCKRYINECAEKTHSCSPFAECFDLPSGYECKCKNGFVDVSSQFSLPPGRKCSAEGHECSNRDLNSCDENADCVQKTDGYTCICAKGYADVSASAKLPPGRVCTLQTTCPAQPSDLTFIVDGSGSIGGDTFKDEVLRFLTEFVELFDISPSQTRVGFIQYSDQIKHELDLGSKESRDDVINAIKNTKYLTGLTRTGQAIEHVVENIYNDKTGNARPLNTGVSRIIIVITDGRSQDNVTEPARIAANKDINMFAVGVTDHVLDKELLEIANNKKDRVFKVTGFKELNNRLRSAIQKVACTNSIPEQTYNVGPCDPETNKGCSGSLNQVCKLINGIAECVCPEGFDKNPVTGVCGGQSCNPDLYTTCPDPEICKITPYGNYLCTCPLFYGRSQGTGVCITPPPQKIEDTYKCDSSICSGEGESCQIGKNGESICGCLKGYERNPKSGKCLPEGCCDPNDINSCDTRKHEKCLPDILRKGIFTCQCPPNGHRDPITDICLLDECYSQDNTCSKNADCIDTLEGYICNCRAGYRDESPDIKNAPGRVCVGTENECLSGRHNCSVNADCIDTRNSFICKCKEGYIDFSPNPRSFGGVDCRELIDECANDELNNCHKDAICINTNNGYECKCKNGFIDRIPFTNIGRDCKKINDLCENGKNDCDKNAKCIEVGDDSYKCICNSGFIDKSKPGEKEGKKCLEQICHDKSKFNCHESAICIESDEFPEKYTCKCRNGYVDENESNPGRQCKELINECLDSSSNDCDPVATCTDLPNGYTCHCPLETKDISPDINTKPGRKCFPLINECTIPQLNNCSRFSDCIDTETSYECKCKSGYADQDLSNPGTNCKFIINECNAANLNDCHKHSECIDLDSGYTCKCKHPYKDVMPSNPGRKCLFNECDSSLTNDCDINAECIDTDDSYICRCKEGFYDTTKNSSNSGRECLKFTTISPVEAEPQITTQNPDLIPCGNGFCKISLGEVCIGGTTCGCKPDEDKNVETKKCEKVNKNPISIRIISKENESGKPINLHYSSEYGSKENPTFVDIVDQFVKGLGDTIHGTPTVSPKYISSSVNYITNPKVENPDWDKGLLFNASVNTKDPIDKCILFKEIEESLEKTNFKLGGGKLIVASDIDQLNPCKPPSPPKGIPCGDNNYCKEELGEICIAGRVCGCPSGQKRKSIDDECKIVEGINLPLWIAREGQTPIKYNNKIHGNPLDEENRRLTTNFEKGISESFDSIPDLKNQFITSEVNDIENPSKLNETWDSGILYNFTTFFTKGSADTPKQIFSKLIDYIKGQNNDEVGKSNLFINPNTPNPFNPCYNAKCHFNSICEASGNSYKCSCKEGFKDINPATPGQVCVSLKNFNECERKEDNECDINARCIDLIDGYKCECKIPYVNNEIKGKIPGSSCKLDYCSDVNYCPLNSTCVNHKDEAVCECNNGYIDLKEEARKLEAAGVNVNKKYLLHGSEGDLVIAPVKDISIKEMSSESLSNNDKICINSVDVNECALGLHDCNPAATCIDLKIGYTCKCNEGQDDMNPQNPGRVCAEPVCGQCHLHGDCITDSKTGNITCACFEGYTGEFCELSSAAASTIFWIILALLFLLLTLLCCLYMCLKTRCFRGSPLSKSSLSGHEEILGGEDFYTIPRAKLKSTYPINGSFSNANALERYLDSDEMSMNSGDSIIERRVITDVSVKETTTTRIQDENGETHEEVTVNYLPSNRTVDYGHKTHSASNQYEATHEGYEEDSENEYFDTEKVDKTTKHFNEHGRDDQGDFERFKSETSTKSVIEEKKYY